MSVNTVTYHTHFPLGECVFHRCRESVPPTLIWKQLVLLREDIKYYFADIVRKGGTPPPPLLAKISPHFFFFFGGVPPPPPPPFTDIPPKNLLKKVLKMVIFAQKTPVFGPKNRLRIWGVLPPPLYGQNFRQKGGYGC